MNTPPLVLPRDCYDSYQVRKMFGRRNDTGQIVPISRATLKRWRTKGKLDFIKMNCRVFLYPRSSVEDLVRDMNSTLPTAA